MLQVLNITSSVFRVSPRDFLFLLGNVYVTDRNNHLIRKITMSTGIITTIAGTGSESYSGDNGDATAATFSHPYGIALDSAGTQ